MMTDGNEFANARPQTTCYKGLMQMNQSIPIPPVFEGARDYRYDHSALEAAQQTFNEERLYQYLEDFARQWYVAHSRPATLLDLCSATGLAALRVAKSIPLSGVTLVDIDIHALERASKALSELGIVHQIRCEDAVTIHGAINYDIILMNSAYHHIEDERKATFMQNAASALAVGGVCIVGEHFISAYAGRSDFRRSVISFYKALITELERRSESSATIDVIRQSGLYCYRGEYEYKVSWDHFLQHVIQSGWRVDAESAAWVPYPEQSNHIGSYAIQLKR